MTFVRKRKREPKLFFLLYLLEFKLLTWGQVKEDAGHSETFEKDHFWVCYFWPRFEYRLLCLYVFYFDARFLVMKIDQAISQI